MENSSWEIRMATNIANTNSRNEPITPTEMQNLPLGVRMAIVLAQDRMNNNLKKNGSTEISNALKIIKVGDPILRERAESVTDVKEVRQLCSNMLNTLRASKGVGIAAPQVGISKRIVIVEADRFLKKVDRSPYIMINPEIKSKSYKLEEKEERCLSIPNHVGLVQRHKIVNVEYIDINGEKKIEMFDGLLARIVQHECDHLDGILYIDREKLV